MRRNKFLDEKKPNASDKQRRANVITRKNMLSERMNEIIKFMNNQE